MQPEKIVRIRVQDLPEPLQKLVEDKQIIDNYERMNKSFEAARQTAENEWQFDEEGS